MFWCIVVATYWTFEVAILCLSCAQRSSSTPSSSTARRLVGSFDSFSTYLRIDTIYDARKYVANYLTLVTVVLLSGYLYNVVQVYYSDLGVWYYIHIGVDI